MKHMVFDYLPLGLRVVPCAWGTKRPLIKDWTTRASNDPEQIQAWLKERPRANWAVLTGRMSSVIVIDVESEGAWRRLNETHGRILAPICRTGAGYHIYVRYPVEIPLRSKVTLQDGALELRGNNHLCLLPPSLHPDFDVNYAWLPGYEPQGPVPFPEAPAWVIEAMRQPPALEPRLYVPREGSERDPLGWAEREMRKLIGTEGDRNNTLNRLCFWLSRHPTGPHLPYDQILPVMLPAYVATGMDEKSGINTIRSATKKD